MTKIITKKTTNTKFYTFNQNNSGGSFKTSEQAGISEYVIIEALNARDANLKAEVIGLYFNGCENDNDCPCCGDRWSPIYEGDGYGVPYIYNIPLSEVKKSYYRDSCYVHYLNGKIEKVEFKENDDDTN